MRIVIDLQGAQSTGSRNRGIGRYSISIVKSIIENKNGHDIYLVLSNLFPDTILPLREEFKELVPSKNIHVWDAPKDISFLHQNLSKRKIAEKMREAFLESLEPDIVLVTSIFEGLVDDAVVSISEFTKLPTCVILYDLIPFIHPTPYLENHDVKAWYLTQLEYLKKADLLLSISESSRQEGIQYLNFDETNITNISTAAESHFKQITISPKTENTLREKYELSQPFVMYTGGIDHRKNIEKLIEAFSMLPNILEKKTQLAIVCSIQDHDKMRLLDLSKSFGLTGNSVVFTGYVPEEDLIALYNLCEFFVFPSWHEGFGLPVLEAMSCGKAVIGSNCSSIPEVIGCDEALFDPMDLVAIKDKMEQVLSDENFRKKLEKHSREQSRKFSWDQSGKTAIKALEQWQKQQRDKNETCFPAQKPKLAYISPLPPERSGISDYSAELLPVLSKFYDIDVIIEQDMVSDEWTKENCSIRNVQWFRENYQTFDRILYHFGNSHFHQHMFDLLEKIPGIVVLHDFYLSGIIHHIEATSYKSDFFTDELFKSHGYVALKDRFDAKDIGDVIWKYPASLSVLQNATGVIVHSENSKRLAEAWYGNNASNTMQVIPLLRAPVTLVNQNDARTELSISNDAFVICSFGMLGPTKLNHRLLKAFTHSSLAKNKNCHLIFVGENHSGQYGAELNDAIEKSGIKNQIRITGWTDTEVFRKYLAIADIGVQLRTLSRGETSAAVLDCMNYGLPTIVNANGSMADLPKHAVKIIDDDFKDNDLISALEELYEKESLRNQLGKNAKDIIDTLHNPDACAAMYKDTIEGFYQSEHQVYKKLIDNLASELSISDEKLLIDLASAISKNILPEPGRKQLFIDISELVQRDAKSGIQRVVKAILKELLINPPKGFKVEPVYADMQSMGYKYARQFTANFLNIPIFIEDEPIDFYHGDMFIGLDLQPSIVACQKDFFVLMRNFGVQVYFIVYDLLCINKSEFFASDVYEGFKKWLDIVLENDGAICISKAVSKEMTSHIKTVNIKTKKDFLIDWFHLGTDIDNSNPSKGLPKNADDVLNKFKLTKTFLMVGTIEPRKGNRLTLEAFEKLWSGGEDISLVMVGKQGWMMEDFIAKIKNHPELNKRLFWLEGISDEYLEKVYAASTCLIAASEGEGFGLPLIEAAQHKKSIIARDIPVFREVAGEFAYYFDNSNEPNLLAHAIQEWLELYKNDQHPKSDAMPWLTWEESAKQLVGKILHESR